MNLVILMGRIGQEPELRFTDSGKARLRINLATTSSFKNREGEWSERTEWHRVSVWGTRAEGLAKILSKGEFIGVEGSIRYGEYEKDGIKRYTTDINARHVTLTGRSGGGSNSGGQHKQRQSNSRSAPKAAPMPNRKPDLKTADYTAQNDFGDDDDIPF